jgi:glycosyltransferase involved in cell wall biosynthesis
MRKVLILSYWYPPKNVIGAIRLVKFAKFLPEFGWEPIIVTVEPRTNLYTHSGTLDDELKIGRVYRLKDWSLNELVYSFAQGIRRLVPAKRRKHETARDGHISSELARNPTLSFLYRQIICFPDECFLWRFLGSSKISQIVDQEKPDLILSSSLPNTVHWIASKMHKRFEIPWVADFRDLWTQNPYFERIGLLKGIERRLEKRVLNHADSMITISEDLRAQLGSHYDQEIHVIPNGFDPSDLEKYGEHNATNKELESRKDKLVITFTGSIYPEKRDPSPLFEALILLQENGEDIRDIELHFYGKRQEFVRYLVQQRYGLLKDLIVLHGEVSREKALMAQVESDALLLIEWTDPKAKGVYTGKLFEYLATGKPILSIAPINGAIHNLIEDTGAGLNSIDPTEIMQTLKGWIEEFRSHRKIEPTLDNTKIEKFNRRNQTERLAQILDDLLQST